MRHFLAQACFAIQAIIRVFRAFDWLARISGVETMVQKPKLVKIQLPQTLTLSILYPWPQLASTLS